MGKYSDNMPESFMRVTTYKEAEVEGGLTNAVANLNFRGGYIQGLVIEADRLEAELKEMTEKFEIARRYQRALDVEALRETYGGMANYLDELPLT